MGPEKDGQIQDQTKSQRRILQREIPLPPLRQIIRRVASFWSCTSFILFILFTWLLIWSFSHRCDYWSDIDSSTLNGGISVGRMYLREFRLVGSNEAFQFLCSKRPYLMAGEKDGEFRVWELPSGVQLRKEAFFPQYHDAAFKIYHSDCEHPDGADCILNGTYFRERFLSLPIIYFNLLFLILAIIFARRNYRRTRPGCCRHCGYSMIGNESGICPECGSDKGANPMDAAAVPSL